MMSIHYTFRLTCHYYIGHKAGGVITSDPLSSPPSRWCSPCSPSCCRSARPGASWVTQLTLSLEWGRQGWRASTTAASSRTRRPTWTGTGPGSSTALSGSLRAQTRSGICTEVTHCQLGFKLTNYRSTLNCYFDSSLRFWCCREILEEVHGGGLGEHHRNGGVHPGHGRPHRARQHHSSRLPRPQASHRGQLLRS